MLRRHITSIPIRRLRSINTFSHPPGPHHSGRSPPYLRPNAPGPSPIQTPTNISGHTLESKFKPWPETLTNLLLDPPAEFLPGAPEPPQVDPAPPNAQIKYEPDPEAMAALRKLWEGLAQNELEPMLEGFKMLRARNALNKLAEEDVVKMTDLLSDYLSRAPPGETRQQAQVMAAHFAFRGVPEPLNVAMAFHLREKNFDAIFGLWDELAHWGKARVISLDRRRTWMFGKDKKILYVATAAAFREDFQRLWTAMRTTNACFGHDRIEAFIHEEMLNCDGAVRQRFRDYLGDAMLRRDVQYQQMLYSHVNDLVTNGDSSAMVELVDSILDALERKILVTGLVEVPEVSKQISMPVYLGEAAWSLLVWGAAHCRNIQLAEKVMAEMQKHGVKPSINCWNYLMYSHTKQGQIGEIQSLLSQIRQSQTEPDMRTYSIVMSVLFDRRLVREARQTFELIKELPVPQDDEARVRHQSLLLGAYNLAINGYLRAQLFQEANEVLQDMEGGKGPKPDIVTYNTFLNRYMHMGDREAVADTLKRIAETGVKPDIYTFTILFVGACRDKDRRMQIKITGQMHGMKLQPGVELLSAALDSIFSSETRDTIPIALEFLSRMERDTNPKRRPNVVTYHTAMHGIGRLQDAGVVNFTEAKFHIESIYRRMIKEGHRPNRVVQHLMMRMYLRDKDPASLGLALSIFDELKRTQDLNLASWYALLSGLETRGERVMAKKWADEFKSMGWETQKGSLLRLLERISAR